MKKITRNIATGNPEIEIAVGDKVIYKKKMKTSTYKPKRKLDSMVSVEADIWSNEDDKRQYFKTRLKIEKLRQGKNGWVK